MYWSNGAASSLRGFFFSINEATTTLPEPGAGGLWQNAKLQGRRQYEYQKNVSFLLFTQTQYACVFPSRAAHWPSTVVMPLRWCQHKSSPRSHCRDDGTWEERGYDLWPGSMDSVWLLFTPELSCVDTKWLNHSGRQWARQTRGSVLSDQRRNPATQSDNTKHIHNQTNRPVPGLPLSSLLLHLYCLLKKKKRRKVTSLDLLASVLEWGWKKCKFWKRRESPFVCADKVGGMKRSLLWIWSPPQTAWAGFFFLH